VVRVPPVLLLGPVLAALLCAAPAPASTLHVLGEDGRVRTRADRYLPPPDPRPAVTYRASARPSAHAAAATPKRTVRGELRDLLAAGTIDQATHDAHIAIWDRAQETLTKLRGRRRVELKAVLANLDAVAASGGLMAGRLHTAFETVARNRQWWSTGSLLGYGQRVSFAGSRLVWQSYPGQGLQIQWLGTFGKANGLFLSGNHDLELGELLDEAAAHASPRAGGLAWESWFRFDGGRPPWVSAMSQGTAVQALSRAAVRLGRPAYFETARAALGIFRTPAPEGIRVDVGGPGAGRAHYLIYSFAPKLRVLNGFVQSLIGLRDFGALANDADGRALFAAGEAQLRAEVPTYDTGAWSRYSQARESDLGYHKLLRDFLSNLCGRMTDDQATAAHAVPPATAPDPALYCDTAQRFTGYLAQPPELALHAAEPSTPRVRRRVSVPYTLSKISTVTTRVTTGGRFVAGRTVRLGRGRHRLRFTPRQAGPYAISVRVVDLAGNATAATGALRVRAAAGRRP